MCVCWWGGWCHNKSCSIRFSVILKAYETATRRNHPQCLNGTLSFTSVCLLHLLTLEHLNALLSQLLWVPFAREIPWPERKCHINESLAKHIGWSDICVCVGGDVLFEIIHRREMGQTSEPGMGREGVVFHLTTLQLSKICIIKHIFTTHITFSSWTCKGWPQVKKLC